MTASFLADPLLLLLKSGLLPPGNTVTGWRMVPGGSLEFLYEGIDAFLPEEAEPVSPMRLMLARTAGGRLTSWLEPEPPPEKVLMDAVDEAMRHLFPDDPDASD